MATPESLIPFLRQRSFLNRSQLKDAQRGFTMDLSPSAWVPQGEPVAGNLVVLYLEQPPGGVEDPPGWTPVQGSGQIWYKHWGPNEPWFVTLIAKRRPKIWSVRAFVFEGIESITKEEE